LVREPLAHTTTSDSKGHRLHEDDYPFAAASPFIGNYLHHVGLFRKSPTIEDAVAAGGVLQGAAVGALPAGLDCCVPRKWLPSRSRDPRPARGELPDHIELER